VSDGLDIPEEENDEPTAPFWMATFSDMATILLTFFVMIVAMSEVEVKKFEAALSYFTGRSGILNNEAISPSVQSPTMEQGTATYEEVMRYEEVLKYLDENELSERVEVYLTERGLQVTMTDSVMFRSGEAVLLPSSQTILAIVSQVLQQGVQSVVVEGHTDNRPISTKIFPSNWELSAARSTAVVRYLAGLDNALPLDHYVAVGYGEFRPVADNATQEGRNRNRRVEILFSWKKWNHQSSQTLPQTP
jgi:chemotaxis protein MotB